MSQLAATTIAKQECETKWYTGKGAWRQKFGYLHVTTHLQFTMARKIKVHGMVS
jgi:hypothetical protein